MKFHEMTAPELRKVPRDSTVIVAPIAACEQHSRHLPTFTDTILVTGVAEGVEQRLPKQVLLLPTLWLGASHHHLRFGGTLSAEVDTHVHILCDMLDAAAGRRLSACAASERPRRQHRHDAGGPAPAAAALSQPQP